MSYEVSNQPYEALFRWNQAGQLTGGHVQRRLVILVDGVPTGESVQPAESIAIDGNGNFPLADIMTEVQAGAIAQANALAAQVTEAQAALASMTAARDAALARVAELEVQSSG